TYHYQKGDGNDVINDSSGNDVLMLKDINASEVSISKENNDAVITVNPTGETIRLSNQFLFSVINTIIFANEEQWSEENITEYASWIRGTEANDTLSGSTGDDHLEGGKGDDILDGSFGDDTYHYQKGDGNDVIDDFSGNNSLILEDVNASEVSVSKNGYDAVITIDSTGETITLGDQFLLGGAISSVIFADEIQWSEDNITEYAWIRGTDSDDTLSGSISDDHLEGGKGDDTLRGSSGNDTYHYHKGDGNDVINDSSGSNILILEDINVDEVSVSKDGYDAVITIDSTGETITLDYQFLFGAVSSITFADGVQWTKENIVEHASLIKGTDSADVLAGTSSVDRIEGGEGNDSLSGLGGNDVFVFKENFGQDTISDFQQGDIIEFTDNTFDSYAEVLAAIADDGSNTTITLDAENSIVLDNVLAAELQSDDFRFV
ncbi:calcium-binding protein, partial [Marinomonas transparens]